MASGAPRFWVDASLMGLGKGYAWLRKDVLHPGHGHELAAGLTQDDPDVVWMPEVARRGLIAIQRDKHTLTRPAERAAVIAAGLRVVVISVKRDLNTWGYNELLVRHWARIEELAEAAGAGPWRIRVLEREVKLDMLP